MSTSVSVSAVVSVGLDDDVNPKCIVIAYARHSLLPVAIYTHTVVNTCISRNVSPVLPPVANTSVSTPLSMLYYVLIHQLFAGHNLVVVVAFEQLRVSFVTLLFFALYKWVRKK